MRQIGRRNEPSGHEPIATDRNDILGYPRRFDVGRVQVSMFEPMELDLVIGNRGVGSCPANAWAIALKAMASSGSHSRRSLGTRPMVRPQPALVSEFEIGRWILELRDRPTMIA